MPNRALVFFLFNSGSLPYVIEQDCTLATFKAGRGVAAGVTTDPSATADLYNAGADSIFNNWITWSDSTEPIQLNFPLRAGETIFLASDASGTSTLIFDIPSAESPAAN